MEIKHLGLLHYFLGFEVHPTSAGIHMSQTKYALELFKQTNMLNCKPSNGFIASCAQLSNQDGTLFSDLFDFCHLLGFLQYLTLTLSNITYAVNHISQFMYCPTHMQLIAAKRVYVILRALLNMAFHSGALLCLLCFMGILMLIKLGAWIHSPLYFGFLIIS